MTGKVFKVGFISKKDASNAYYNEIINLPITESQMTMLSDIYKLAFKGNMPNPDVFMKGGRGADMSRVLDKMMDYCTQNIGEINSMMGNGTYGEIVLLISKLLYVSLQNSGKGVVLFTEKQYYAQH